MGEGFFVALPHYGISFGSFSLGRTKENEQVPQTMFRYVTMLLRLYYAINVDKTLIPKLST